MVLIAVIRRVRVQVVAVQELADTGVEPGLALLLKVEARPEVLEHLPVVPAASDDRAEHGRERVPGHSARSSTALTSSPSMLRSPVSRSRPASSLDRSSSASSSLSSISSRNGASRCPACAELSARPASAVRTIPAEPGSSRVTDMIVLLPP